MADITGFGEEGTGYGSNFGSPTDGWTRTFGGTMAAVDNNIRINAVLGDITGANVQLYSGWSGSNSAGNALSSIIRTTGDNVVTMSNYSWTLRARVDPTIGTANLGNATTQRNHALNNCAINLTDGKFLMIGNGNDHRFGFGSGNGGNANTVTGTLADTLIQSDNCRVIVQLGAFAPGVVSGLALDDFTYLSANSRVDANFPGGVLYQGLSFGVANVTILDNGNTSGLAASNIGTPLTPTVVRDPLFRRSGTGFAPANRHVHSCKHTPMYFVDPTFAIVDGGVQTSTVVDDNTGVQAWMRPISSSDIGNGGNQSIPDTSGIWFLHEVTFTPQTAAGVVQSGSYHCLTNAGLLDNENVYQVDGVTDANDYGPTANTVLPPLVQTSAGIPTGDFVLLATDAYVNTTGGLVQNSGNLPMIPLGGEDGEKDIVIYVDGYDPFYRADYNPRNERGTIVPTVTPTNWLAPLSHTENSINNAARTIHTYLTTDPTFVPDREETWTDTEILLGGSSGNISQANSDQSYGLEGGSLTWQIGSARQAPATGLNFTGGAITTITNITAPNWDLVGGNETFNGQGLTWNVDNIIDTQRIENGTFITQNALLSAGGTTVTISEADVSGLFIRRSNASGVVTVRLLDGITGVPDIGIDGSVVIESSINITGGTTDTTISVYRLDGNEDFNIGTGTIHTSSAATTTLSSTDAVPIAPGDNLRVVWSAPGFEHFAVDRTIVVGQNADIEIVQVGTPSFTSNTLVTASATIAYTANTMRTETDGTETDIGERGVIRISGARGSAFSEATLSETETNALFESLKGTNNYNTCIAKILPIGSVSPIRHPSDTTTTLLEDFYFLDTGNAGAGQRVTSLLEQPVAGGNAIDIAAVQLIRVVGTGMTAQFGAVEIAERSSGTSYGDLLAVDANAADRSANNVAAINAHTTTENIDVVDAVNTHTTSEGTETIGEVNAHTTLSTDATTVAGYTATGEAATTGIIQRSGAV